MQHGHSRLLALVSLRWQICSSQLRLLRTLFVAMLLLCLIGFMLLTSSLSIMRADGPPPPAPPPGCGASPC